MLLHSGSSFCVILLLSGDLLQPACPSNDIAQEKEIDLGRHLVPAKTDPMGDTNNLRQNGV